MVNEIRQSVVHLEDFDALGLVCRCLCFETVIGSNSKGQLEKNDYNHHGSSTCNKAAFGLTYTEETKKTLTNFAGAKEVTYPLVGKKQTTY